MIILAIVSFQHSTAHCCFIPFILNYLAFLFSVCLEKVTFNDFGGRGKCPTLRRPEKMPWPRTQKILQRCFFLFFFFQLHWSDFSSHETLAVSIRTCLSVSNSLYPSSLLSLHCPVLRLLSLHCLS